MAANEAPLFRVDALSCGIHRQDTQAHASTERSKRGKLNDYLSKEYSQLLV